MRRDLFLFSFRALARRYSDCLAEAYRIGLDNFKYIDLSVIEEIAFLHEEFMKLRLDDADMDAIFAAVDKEELEKVEFYGQWNRVSRFVIIYEEMFGEDPVVLKEAANWAKTQKKQKKHNFLSLFRREVYTPSRV